jgi:hypothetical protein
MMQGIFKDMKMSLKVEITDCIAETTNGDRHYMIVYQIDQRRAYSCRTDPFQSSRPMEVSGPYPVTDNEYNTLRGLKTRNLVNTAS